MTTSFYYGGTVGNEVGLSDPAFMKKYGKDLEQDSGKWIDSSVWHGKAHTWDKIKWLIAEASTVKRMPPTTIPTYMNSGRKYQEVALSS